MNGADIPVDLDTIYTSTSEDGQETLSDTGYQWDENGRLTGISWNKCAMSGHLDLSELTALTELYCHDNKLSELDVSQNTELTGLYCYKNELTSLDISGATALRKLSCYSNQLERLEVSQNKMLRDLNCWGNKLSELDVSQNTSLLYLSYDQDVCVTGWPR